MFVLLVCIAVSVVVGLALSLVMFRRDDALVGLVGLAVLMGAGMLGVVYAALASG